MLGVDPRTTSSENVNCTKSSFRIQEGGQKEMVIVLCKSVELSKLSSRTLVHYISRSVRFRTKCVCFSFITKYHSGLHANCTCSLVRSSMYMLLTRALMKQRVFIIKLLLVFSVTPFKIDFKKSKHNRLSPESGNRKKVDMQSLSPRFRSQQVFLWKICGQTFSPNL